MTSHDLARQLLAGPDLPVALWVNASIPDEVSEPEWDVEHIDALHGNMHKLEIELGLVRLIADEDSPES
jgi:hypothetical protein